MPAHSVGKDVSWQKPRTKPDGRKDSSMHIIIVGAQPVGEHLMKLAVESGHDVTLIEPEAAIAEQCSQNYDVQVLQARIDEEGILDEADASRAGALIATTSDDSVNLMAMVLGREYEIDNL